MHYRYLLLALLVPTLATGQIPWTWLNPEPIGQTVNDLDMIDMQTGWALATGGILLKTTDGGVNWDVHDLGLWQYGRNIQFIGSDTGWVSMDRDGGLLRTTDGGLSWSLMNTGLVVVPVNGPRMYFADHLHGWLLHTAGEIHATTDGGTTWAPQVSNTTAHLHNAHFADALTGCAVGANGTIVRTIDGGQTWAPVNSGTTNTLYSVTYSDALNVWATPINADSVVYHSADAGLTWTEVNIGYDLHAYHVYFRTPQEGWILTAQAAEGMYHTTDGGQSWTPVGTGSIDMSLLEYTDALHAVGGGGCASELGWTTDAGATWTTVNNSPTDTWQDLQFVDPLNGYACGYYNVVRTTDGGDTWTTLNVPPQPYSTLHFIDPLEGWIAGGTWNNQPNRLYHTTDGGQIWDTVIVPTVNFVYDVWFTDPLHGWVASNINGSTSRTTDGGATWTTYDPTSGGNYSLVRVQFLDSLHGWLTGTGGQRYWSDDGGVTWNPGFAALGQHTFWGLAFRDTSVGVVCADTIIRYTTDGGASWSDALINDQQPRTYGSLRGLAWVSADEVWCVGGNGAVLRSTDTGINWTVLDRGRIPSYSISWSGQALYVGGGCASVVRLDDLSVPVAETSSPQQDGTLYPNPNDGRTFQLATTRSGTTALLRVFDSSGRLQAQQRVNSNGNGYTITLSSALAPGTYTVVLAHADSSAQRWAMVVVE